jgi:diguanylate cyclase (GGDEF)-like protein
MPSRLAQLLFAPPGRRRQRVLMVLLGLAVYALFAVLQHVEVLLGFIDAHDSAWLTGYFLAGSLLFYLLVRSGWSEHLVRADPSLMLPQILHGLLAVIWSYAITGPARGAVLAILVLLLAFAMFGLSVRQSRGLALMALTGLVLVMLWKSQTEPLRYPPAVEAVHLVFALVVLFGVTVLSRRMGELRAHLRRQRGEIEVSLERIRVLATQDELTGLVNRRHMTALLAAEQARQQRSGAAMSLVLIDLDHFKQINDSLGHLAGDAVLQAFVAAITPGLRHADVLARWGGEEFLLLLPDTGAQDGLQCVERLRTILDGTSFDAIAPGLRVGFSAGLATCQPGDDVVAVLERADQAMYRAKQAGRHRTVCA